MGRNRFDWLLGHIHLNNNILQPKRGEQNFDKLFKLRPFLDSVSQTFKSFYKVKKNNFKQKSRSFIRQYMPNKPIRWGYKIWTRADDTGYIDEFQIYTGKTTVLPENNLGERVVLDLTRSLQGKGYFVYFDNFFTSLPLLRQLRAEKIYASGTIRKHRKGMPADFLPDKSLSRGEYDWRNTIDGISCVKWMDKRIVLIASNFENPTELDIVKRKQKNGEIKEVTCLIVLKNYNQNMGFVDKEDMLKKIYEINRKSQKWWPRIFWHFIDVAVVNSYIIFQSRCYGKKRLSLKEFLLSVIAGLVGAGSTKTGQAKRQNENSINTPPSKFKKMEPLEVRTDQSLHMPIHDTSRRCALCSTKQHQKRSN